MTDVNTPTGADEQRAALEAMRLAELQALAAELQIVGAGRLRKGELVDAISDAPAVPAAEGAAPAAESDDAGDAGDTESAAAEPVGDQGEQRSGRSRRGRNRNRSGGEGGQNGPAGQGGQNGQSGSNGQGTRQADTRRGRGRGAADDLDPEIGEDDVLIPVAGILDVLDNYAFVRTTGYLPGPSDVYVALGQVKKYGLRKGDAVVGAIRQPREGEQQGRQKYNALVKVDSVNGLGGEQSAARPEFAALTPVRASEPYHVAAEAPGGPAILRGQRRLVTGVGGTSAVGRIADELGANHPDVHQIVILVDPRPEEATEFRRRVKGEVVVASIEQGAEEHVTVVELAIERAKRLVELGIDVVVLIDSISRLGRAYASLAPRAGADDPGFAVPVKRLFGAARATEEGATLTIVATASETGAVDGLLLADLRSLANAAQQL